MDIIKTFILDNTEHKVNIIWQDDTPLFQANQIAQIIDIKNIRDSVKNFDEDEKCLEKIYTPGGDQITTFLTEQGVYRLLMRSNKPIARPFQKWLINILVSIREKGKYELKEEIEKIKNDNKYNLENIKTENEIIIKKYTQETFQKTHQIMMDSFDFKNVVYFLRIKELDDKILIKIGSTQDIKNKRTWIKK